ncbi:2-dehydro-3-deoxygluconokinase [Cytobacillus horneckiae]|uniref:Sugar kinase n=1 Tax=Cytobacillus horneckiae TaxID=549687 RepID=A0A2N0ZA46_9BACI|nr:sugar kinase [Cytobacillus horneckiae]MBN6886760.1 sugar kinase [Cytobacillus horneckiae]MEC1158085.1 sugar kinase [Cytobacillus horneckiae]MED2936990.1 sugar kinase [Cytobacillus horneckiae]PKG26386.1 sugar kinase [Cytobacillus horneckiae]
MTNLDVVTFGEPMVMFYANHPEPLHAANSFSRALAGAEANVACGISRLDLQVSYITKLGNDSFGKFIIEALNRENVHTNGILFSNSHSTGMLMKSKVLQGDPEVEYFRKNSAASTLSMNDFSKADFTKARHLHATGIPSALSNDCHHFTQNVMNHMKTHGKSVSFDPNLRPSLWKDKKTMVDTVNKLAYLSDQFLPGLSEAQTLTGLTNPKDIADYYLAKGIKTIVIKLGPEGAYYKTGQEEGFVPGYKPNQVIDTVGAGDGFAVGFISSYLEGKSISEAVKRGNAIGALQVMSPGDMDGMPNRKTLEEFMQQQQLENIADLPTRLSQEI